MEKRYSKKDETFWQKMILPEEDRLADTEWKGVGYRWFKSENIVCLEHYREAETKPAPKLKAS
ncbi:MAG: hypothetical protein WB689_39105 [Xanthobacteraceae bacterium]